MPAARLDTDGLAADWPPPRPSPPRWLKWALPLAVIALLAGLVAGFGGFEQRRYRPEVRRPGTLVTMDGFDIAPLEAFLMPKTNSLTATVEVRIIGVCENRRDDAVSLMQLGSRGVLVVDPLHPSEPVSTELWAGTWTGVGSLTLPPGQGQVPCFVKATFPDTFQPTGTALLQLSDVTYADRSILQLGTKSWGGATQDYIYYLPLSLR